MAEQPAKVRDVAWFELFSWLMLARSVRIALMARVLLLGAIGLILTALGWWVISSLFSRSDDVVIQNWHAKSPIWLWDESPGFDVPSQPRSAAQILSYATKDVEKTPGQLWLYLTKPFIEMFSAGVTWVGFLFLLLCGVWALIVWGVIGGAITRIAALKFTRDEAPGPVAAVSHVLGKLPSYSLPPLIALGGAAVFAIQLAILGVLMNIGFFAFLGGLAWPFVLMLGLLMAILLLGALVGWPLMWATISVEGTDAFDALSRSYAYTYQRPWRLLWYVLVVAVLAIVSMFVVKVFALTTTALGDWSVDWGASSYTMENVVRPEPNAGASSAVNRETERAAIRTDAGTSADDIPADTTAAPQLVDPNAAAGDALQPARTETTAAAVPPHDPGLMRNGARRAISFWKWLMEGLAAGYQAGFLWVAAVGVYLLLRRDIDGVQTSEVYVDQDAEFGLPPLAEDAATGVPEVSSTEPARAGDVANPADLPRSD
jgi:hypothetical protein